MSIGVEGWVEFHAKRDSESHRLALVAHVWFMGVAAITGNYESYHDCAELLGWVFWRLAFLGIVLTGHVFLSFQITC